MGIRSHPLCEAGTAPACGLCGGAGNPWITRAGYRLFRCTSCGNGFLPRSCAPADLERLYSPEYFSGLRSTGYPGYLRESPMLERNFTDRLRWIERIHPPGKILDVGAAYGLFLRVARTRGWEATGVEISGECAREAERLSGARVVGGDFLKVELPGHQDVITFFDVIEHMRDPLACFRRAMELLSPGGWLVIETGDPATPWARLLGRYWYFLDPPQHLFYFTEAGLGSALARCGFTGQSVRCRPGRRVTIANIAFKLETLLPAMLRPVVGVLGRLPGSLYLRFGDGLLLAVQRP